MLQIKTNLYPKDGYIYREADGTLFRESNWNKVVKKVREYRLLKGIPVGDPVEDVTRQACSRQPTLCYDRAGVTVPVPIVSLKSKVLKWLIDFVNRKKDGATVEYVSPNEAANRAAICAGCPLNVQIGVNSCSSCKQSVDSSRSVLLGGRVRHPKISACSGLAVDLVTAVHLDEIRIENADLPSHCWRKKAL